MDGQAQAWPPATPTFLAWLWDVDMDKEKKPGLPELEVAQSHGGGEVVWW